MILLYNKTIELRFKNLQKNLDIHITCDILIYSMDQSYKQRIGKLIQSIRIDRGLTQQEMAKTLNTSQSAVNRIENGGQNLSMEMLARIRCSDQEIISLNRHGSVNFKIDGGHKLHGEIEVKTL